MSISLNLKTSGDPSNFPQDVKKSKSEKVINSIKGFYKQVLDSDISYATELLKKCREFKKEDLYDKRNLADFIQSIYCLPLNPELLKDNPIYSIYFNMGECRILELNECACIDASRIPVEHSKSLGLRSQFEYQIIKKIEKHHGDKKLSEKALRLMSFGCGGCLSEWMIAAQLVLNDFTCFELHLIDRDSGSGLWQDNLKQFLEHFPDTKITVSSYRTLEEFGEKNIACDVAYALDLDRTKYTDDLVKLKFSPNGFTYASKFTPHWDVKDAKTSYHLTS